ncbi:alpha/beta fold hydrolase [Cellulomonas persica]|uniref:Lysophospholipase n=1 Tax=Cellulomonas persica TaxID=76861 RepID=A0A510UXB6_9CELL|nr:alpha/beta hydrolase [Cellulomonas persica]GEK18151.1 lysophospholipase [Cellulomonas persica]
MGDVGVVLVHGVRTSRTMWRPQTEALARAGIPTTAVDLPGHGTRADERFSVDAAVATIADAVGALGGKALVVGLSLGGYVGVTYAARHPEQVVGLVAAGCCTRPRRVLVGGWAALAAALARLPDRGAGLNDAFVRLMLPATAGADLAAGGFALDVMADVLREVGALDPVADLARVRVPVWLVNGRYDHFRGDERAYLAACGDGRLVVVPGATHLVSVVAPVRFTRVVLEAYDEVCRLPLDAQTGAQRVAAQPAVPQRTGSAG